MRATDGFSLLFGNNPCLTCKINKGAGVSNMSRGTSAFNSSNLGEFSTNLKLKITFRFNGVIMNIRANADFAGMTDNIDTRGLSTLTAVNCGF